MANFKEFLLLQESLTKKTNYIKLDTKYINMFNQVLDAKKYLQISLFNVNNKQYYCILIMKDSKLEPHFGVFYENKFNELVEAFKNKDAKKINDLVNSELFIQKDGYLNSDANFLKVLSYVFSVLVDYLAIKPIGFVKIMGIPRKFKLYQKVVKNIIQKNEIPYHIVIEEQDDSYSGKITGQTNPAKSMILKYNFA
ncbi:hypothetical protein [Campylobacter phage vB_CcoM-IBB_35]|uniref:Uncharacterized protein n=1 Tax=Campylobacter virus IBB35 TaxID=1006972 RepID=H6SU93_9CAUD|nr:hypothetical protein FDG52_s1gp50 [Campylobacter phage vB_CcoM-IBB_35]AEF56785.1 hypothetical protein [Campylobacter phage vB_CcoM-IBB_35]